MDPRYKNCCFGIGRDSSAQDYGASIHHRSHRGGGSVETRWAVASPGSCFHLCEVPAVLRRELGITDAPSTENGIAGIRQALPPQEVGDRLFGPLRPVCRLRLLRGVPGALQIEHHDPHHPANRPGGLRPLHDQRQGGPAARHDQAAGAEPHDADEGDGRAPPVREGAKEAELRGIVRDDAQAHRDRRCPWGRQGQQRGVLPLLPS